LTAGVSAFDLIYWIVLIGNFTRCVELAFSHSRVWLLKNRLDSLFISLEKILEKNFSDRIFNLANGISFCFLAGADDNSISKTAVWLPFDMEMPKSYRYYP